MAQLVTSPGLEPPQVGCDALQRVASPRVSEVECEALPEPDTDLLSNRSACGNFEALITEQWHEAEEMLARHHRLLLEVLKPGSGIRRPEDARKSDSGRFNGDGHRNGPPQPPLKPSSYVSGASPRDSDTRANSVRVSSCVTDLATGAFVRATQRANSRSIKEMDNKKLSSVMPSRDEEAINSDRSNRLPKNSAKKSQTRDNNKSTYSEAEFSFTVLSAWKQKRNKNVGQHLRSSLSSGETGHSRPRAGSASYDDLDVAEDKKTTSRVACLCVHPYDWRRGSWDIASMLFVLYDMVWIPLQFLDAPSNWFSTLMNWLTRLFWTLDMPLSFLTGYVTVDGFIELRSDRIIRRYLHSWFLLDIFIICIDWSELILVTADSTLGIARMSKATRTFRIVRMLRLLRLARMRQVMDILTERLRSEKVVVIFDIIKLIISMVSFAHFIACFWYGVGIMQSREQSNSWVYKRNLQEASLRTRYAVALHWSISQFAGGMDEVTPESYHERVYAILAFLGAFVVAAWFISSLTSSMTQLNIIGSDKTQQLSTLRVYLNQNGISHKLALRVHRNAQHALAEQQRTLPASNVELLRLVSVPLHVEIHMEMYTPHLNCHPFFQEYIEQVPQVMRKVCHFGTSMLSVQPGDVIFSAGEIPEEPKMFIVCNGVLKYHRHGGEWRVIERQCVSEAVLWTEWVHLGDFVSTTDCKICAVDADVFQKIAMHFDHDGLLDPRDYAEKFCTQLNVSTADVSDIFKTDYRNGKSERRKSRISIMNTSPQAPSPVQIAGTVGTPFSRLWRGMFAVQESRFESEQSNTSR